ncbi:hypothetical protein CENSYa_1749 [Cenarchaeum symbiosum A]|uniref:Uncharacterized protein n=1 Tax=Cenarchaeum symbiosum (strain A) TaxID=414004 RepID=A0RYE3_CENSY|nr:hypothetical protein CENSYa_1749 [Cenarchaeum symbiosum A]
MDVHCQGVLKDGLMCRDSLRLAVFYAGVGAFTILGALALIPAGADIPQGAQLYGMAEAVHRNAEGDILGSHIAHNRILDPGEDALIKSVFKVGSPFQPNRRLDALCLYGINDVNARMGDGELKGQPQYFNDDSCVDSRGVGYTPGTGVVTLEGRWTGGPDRDCDWSNTLNRPCDPDINCGETNISPERHNNCIRNGGHGGDAPGGRTVGGIVVCSILNGANHNNCRNVLDTIRDNGRVQVNRPTVQFAAVVLEPTVLARGDTLSVTYTFNASTPNS